jgi:hypothetical protein
MASPRDLIQKRVIPARGFFDQLISCRTECECGHRDGGVLCAYCAGMVKRLVAIDRRIKAGETGDLQVA